MPPSAGRCHHVRNSNQPNEGFTVNAFSVAFQREAAGSSYRRLLEFFCEFACHVTVVPAGLNPGDQYRLIFVSSNGTARDGTSTNIADYNDFVLGIANAVPGINTLGASWFAILSTAATSAVTNIGTSTSSVGIYLLDGTTKVADGTAGLFGSALLAKVNMDEQGNIGISKFAFTGSNADGTSSATEPVGASRVIIGNSNFTDGQWLAKSDDPAAHTGEVYYAISSVLTVPPTPSPEPASLGMAATGAVLILLARRRKA